MSNQSRRSELLMPAGSLEKLKVAVLYGADAVYMGTPDLSLRVKSQMSLDDVVEGIEFAHEHGVRVYLTLNLFSHNKDIDKLPEYVDTVRKVRPDGLIVADPGVFMFVREHAPELDLHVSTQANVCSWQSVKFWQSIGAKLVVLGREVSYEELTEIRAKCQDIKIEAFVHGSMCMTYSGRCLLSNFMAERGANQGACANSCRWKYKVHMKLKDGTVKELKLTEENLEMFDFFLEEDMRPGELMEIQEDERGSYILNSRDLCIMPKLEDYLKIGVDSLKVEGRGKSSYYAGLVARAYRMAIDDWYEDPENWSAEEYMKELATIPNRGYTLAFHDGRLTNYAHGYDSNTNVSDWEFAGMIEEVEDDAFIMSVKNRMLPGDVIEIVPPRSRQTVFIRMYEFIDAATGKVGEAVHANTHPRIRLPFSLFEQEDPEFLKREILPMTIVRKEKALSEDEWQRLKLDQEGHKIEMGKGNEERYDAKREALQTALDDRQKERSFRTPRVGTKGCCGRGCNGCLIFWHDESYAKAREILAKRKQGEMLEKDGKTIAAE
ncbi:U32 family peptidase [Thalassospira sp. A3_1]|uniref:U32 family peptidase n=1 Tax=Thalassospira sp. A3_1 TaxID=2821088 RepID=UPI001ADC3A8D|nr:U32 family peptidase [Thalassospira sp. A3_1]MBO9509156.1 U32 family peptidase C-terminal domain-containing protein [Thalassospira sp. A3_1]